MIEIYTDGAYNSGLQQGGWGAVIVEDGKKKQTFSDSVKETTGNRMEITAALESLLVTPPGTEVIIYTDSQYLFGTMTQGWRRKANGDLWAKLDEAVSERKVTWKWINGDSANPFHKEAHTLANSLAGLEAHEFHKERTEAMPEEAGEELTHLDSSGRPRMVDVSAKADTEREAAARCRVRMKEATFKLIKQGKVTKGDVLTVAQLAGIMGSKQTPHLIPLCHPILIDNTKVELVLDEASNAIEITATVKSTGKTGVEMEALTAAAVAALTVYDMCKAVDRAMVIDNLRLIRKSGGKSGTIELKEWD